MTKQERIDIYLNYADKIIIIDNILYATIGTGEESVQIDKDIMPELLKNKYESLGFTITDRGNSWSLEF